MSSPLARSRPGIGNKLLAALHQRLSHIHRVQILGESCASLLRAAFEGRPLRGLDVGCGDQQVSRTIAACLPNSRWRACDLYDLPTALEKDPAWGNYRQMADGVLPFADKTFDVVMFCDVLHHVEREKQADLIQEAVRIGNYLLIKDHFALDAYANIMLRLMDLVGNAPYNVRVLATYFTPDRFDALLGVLKLERVSRLHGIDLYRHLPVLQWLISPQWQFIDLLKAPD